MHFGEFRGKNEAFQGTDFLYFWLLNFNMQKFQNIEHSNSRAFQGLLKEPTLFSRTFKGLEFFFQNSRTFKDFSRTLWTLYYASDCNWLYRHLEYLHSMVNTVVQWHQLGEVEINVPHVSLSSLPSVCRKVSQLVEIWQSSDKNNFAQFFETRWRPTVQHADIPLPQSAKSGLHLIVCKLLSIPLRVGGWVGETMMSIGQRIS